MIGFAIYQAQMGRKHESAKALKGFKTAGVLEIVEDHDGETYRCVYTIIFAQSVYILDAFQKKSKKGIKTPPRDIKRIKTRLKIAEEHYKARTATDEE